MGYLHIGTVAKKGKSIHAPLPGLDTFLPTPHLLQAISPLLFLLLLP